MVGSQDSQKCVQELTVSDGEASIKVALWDAAAVYNQLKQGTQIQVSDATVMYNKYHQATILSVNYVDQLKVRISVDV